MTADKVLELARVLPPGLSEIYLHPATHTDATLCCRHAGVRTRGGNWRRLLDPDVAARPALPDDLGRGLIDGGPQRRQQCGHEHQRREQRAPQADQQQVAHAGGARMAG